MIEEVLFNEFVKKCKTQRRAQHGKGNRMSWQ